LTTLEWFKLQSRRRSGPGASQNHGDHQHRLGEAVYLVDGDPMAFKITTPMDLQVAQALSKG